MKKLALGTAETAQRLDVTEATVRRWCVEQGFGVRLMGRWRIPASRIVELENKLRAAANDDQVPTCRSTSTIFE